MRIVAKGLAGVAFVLGAYAALLGYTPVAAQQAHPGFDIPICEGEISTFPLSPIPQGLRYWVDIFDETDEAVRFREVFLMTLQEAGRGTAENGKLVFSFESGSRFLGLMPRDSTDRLASDTRRARDPGADVGVSKLRDTIRQDRSARGSRSGLGQKIDAKAELRDGTNGRVVWLATLSCEPLISDRKLLMKFVSKIIVDSLNREGGKFTF